MKDIFLQDEGGRIVSHNEGEILRECIFKITPVVTIDTCVILDITYVGVRLSSMNGMSIFAFLTYSLWRRFHASIYPSSGFIH